MKHLRIVALLLFVSISLLNCKKDDGDTPAPTAASQTELLVANKWRLDRVASASNDQTIGAGQMSATTLLLFELDMQFRDDNTVRAINNKTSQVINGGTWNLAADNLSMDVDVNGFKGNFPIVSLTRTTLTLRQRAPVSGVSSDINLEFKASL